MSNMPPEVLKEFQDSLDAYAAHLLAALKADSAAQKAKKMTSCDISEGESTDLVSSRARRKLE